MFAAIPTQNYIHRIDYIFADIDQYHSISNIQNMLGL